MAHIDLNRQTGRTTKQLQALKPDALFVWCNGHTAYPKELAQKLGREDIKIVSPDYVTSDNWKGLRFSEVVLDHAYHTCNKWNLNFQLKMAELRRRCDK